MEPTSQKRGNHRKMVTGHVFANVSGSGLSDPINFIWGFTSIWDLLSTRGVYFSFRCSGLSTMFWPTPNLLRALTYFMSGRTSIDRPVGAGRAAMAPSIELSHILAGKMQEY